MPTNIYEKREERERKKSQNHSKCFYYSNASLIKPTKKKQDRLKNAHDFT